METSWITNNKMKKLLEHVSNCPNEEKLQLSVQQLDKLFYPTLKRVKDCVIISEKSLSNLEKTFDNAMSMYIDKTGYEASNTETRINCYFENEISIEAGTKIALMVIEVWALRLKQIEPYSKFCLILVCDEEYVEIRFHKVRSNEKSWLADNLEEYEDGAVGYVIV